VPQSDYSVNITVKTTDKTSEPAKKASKGLFTLADAAKAVAGAMVVRQIAKYTVEVAKIGAAADRQSTALNNLAAAAGTTGDAITKAIQEASGFTISHMDAMASANRAMVLDVADSPAAFERLTTVAVALGRAMGQDATKSIDDFVTAAGRQSRLIADNLGLMVSAEDANVRYAASIGKTADQLTDAEKKQAFLNEMLRQGEIKLAALGDSTMDAAGSMEQMSAAWSDTKEQVGLIITNLLEMSGALGAVAEGTRKLAQATEDYKNTLATTGDAVADYAEDQSEFFQEQDKGFQQMVIAQIDAVDLATAVGALEDVYGSSTDAVNQYQAAIAQSAASQDAAAYAASQQVEALGPVPRLTFEAARYLDDLAESETIVGNAAQNSASGIDWGRLAIDNLAKSAKEAALAAQQMTDLKFGIQLSLGDQLGRMEEDQKAMAQRREELQAEHQERLLALTVEGDDALIAEENRRHQAAIDGLNEELAKQQEIQQAAMGKFMLQTFDQWAATADVPPDKMAEMRTAIAKEYGLIDDKTATITNAMIREWEDWAAGMGTSTDQVVDYLDGLVGAGGSVYEELAKLTSREWAIRIRMEVSQPSGGDRRQGGEQERANTWGGLGVTGASGLTLNAPRVYNVYDARAAAMLMDRDRRTRSGAPMHLMG